MAVVPVARPTVNNRAYVPVYDSAAGATPDAFGAGTAAALAGVGTALGSAAAVGGDIQARLNYHNAVKQATETANAFDELRIQRLYGTPDQPGYLSFKGNDASAQFQPTLDGLKRVRDDLAGKLTDPRARELFDAHAAVALRTDMTSLARHALTESSRAADAAGEARIRIAGSEAFASGGDPAVVDQSIARIRGAAVEWAQRHGASQEELDQKVREDVSKQIVPLIREMGVKNASVASAMLARYRGLMSPDDILRTEEHLRPKIVAQEADAAIERDLAAVTGGGDDFAQNKRVESGGRQFGPDGKVLTSPKGALGVSQIMEATARETAQKNGITFDLDRLKNDAAYNENLGRLHKAELMQKYGGNRVLADAAYNAGQGNVDEWIKRNGDPRTGAISSAEWAAKIPFPETKRYVADTGAITAASGGIVYPDWAAMQQRIIDRTAGDPDAQAAQLSRLANKRSLFDAQLFNDREKMTRQANDIKAALESGRDDVAIPTSDLFRIFPAAKAADIVAQLEESRDFGRVAKMVQWASPEEVNSLRTALATGQGDLSVFPRLSGKNVKAMEGGGEGGDIEVAALRQRHLQRLDALVQKRQAMLAADPKGYADASPAVQQALASGDLDAYVTASVAEQRRLGVGEYDVRALSPAQTKEIVQQLHRIDPITGDMGAELRRMKDTWGGQWPRVFDDLVRHGKLSPEYQVLADMDMPSQAGAAADMQRALKYRAENPNKFGDSLGPQKRQDIFARLDTQMADFARSSSIGGQRLFDEVVKPAVSTLAIYYGTSMDAREAADKAYQAVIGAKYEFSDRLRVPKGPNGESRIQAVQEAGYGVQERLTEADLRPVPARVNDFRSEQERLAVALAAAKNGVWSAGPDGNSAVLNYLGMDGTYYAVIGKNGNPVSMNFDNLPAPAMNRRGVFSNPMGDR